MATTTSNTGDKVYIYDTVDGDFANALYVLYLNPKQIRGPMEMPLIGIGETRLIIQFIGCTFAKDGSNGNWEKMIRFLAYWADNANDNMLYLVIKDSSNYNIAKWAVPPYSAVSQMKGKVIGMPQIDYSDSAVWRFNLTFQRLTYGA